MRKQFLVFFSVLVVCELILIPYFTWMLWPLVATLFIFAFGIHDLLQTKHAIKRNFPLSGKLRYVMEILRPKIYQYFIESDIDGRPINRRYRSVIYQRAKHERDTTPFGTQLDVYENGYEWINHSIAPLPIDLVDGNSRVRVGAPACKVPYLASRFNVSAMSYGALSKNAILALNKGAKEGGFAHNTGEGGLSPYHLENGGDLIWQIGTGYFSCRDKEGHFSPELFQKKVNENPSIKMIEIKLSQGAKPGHGGILPKAKNTREIASIRHVEPFTDVFSPPYHTAFSNPMELCAFIQKLRDLSNGRPVGFKLCLGIKSEFIALCKAMVETKIYPDFITVDGAEGGTGAAPLEFSDSVGTPLFDALAFVVDTLRGFDLKKHIRVIASGKVLTGFDLIRLFAVGADMGNSARAMMLALGCIQALECNANTCPTGIATHNPELVQGLVVEEKFKRISSFHHETLKAVNEIMAAANLKSPSELTRSHIYRRISGNQVMRYDEIYPEVPVGAFLHNQIPESFRPYFEKARAETFLTADSQ